MKDISLSILSKDPIPIKDVGVQNWYYDKDNTVEDELSKLETKTDKIFLKIIKTRKINSLSKKERNTLNKYIVFQDYRTPKTRNYLSLISERILKESIRYRKKGSLNTNTFPKGFLKEFWECSSISPTDIIKFLKEMEDNKRKFDKFIKITTKRATNNVLRGYLKSGVELFSELSLRLYINKSKSLFYTSDHPVCRYNQYFYDTYGNIPYDGIGYDSKGIQFIFPLNPKICLIFEDTKVYGMFKKKEIVNKGFVNFVNARLIQNSERWINSKNKDFRFADSYLQEFPHFKKRNIMFGLWKMSESDLEKNIWKKYYGKDARDKFKEYVVNKRKKGVTEKDIEILKGKYRVEYKHTLEMGLKKIKCPICKKEYINWKITDRINLFKGKCPRCEIEFTNRNGSLIMKRIQKCPHCKSKSFGRKRLRYECSDCHTSFKLNCDEFIIEI